MYRRRVMFNELKKENKWDIEWDYTMGRLEDNAFEKTTNNASAKSEMKEDGFYITSEGGYIKYNPPVVTAKESIMEARLSCINPSLNNNGLRISLSNGKDGVQIFGNHAGIMTSVITIGNIKIHDFIKGEEYVIRLELINNKAKIIVNDAIVYESDKLNSYYCAENAIFQQNQGTTRLESLKYKFIKMI